LIGGEKMSEKCDHIIKISPWDYILELERKSKDDLELQEDPIVCKYCPDCGEKLNAKNN